MIEIPAWPQAGDREKQLLEEVLASAQWGGFHPFVTEFERHFARYQHTTHAIAAANGTLTLEAMLTAVGIRPGDEVIVPAISFVTTAMAVSRVGALPVFVDIGRDTYNLDPDSVRAAVSPRTKAVMAVHFAGTFCAIDELEAICREADLLLLEDAAHAHGAEWQGRAAGSFGLVSSFSLQNGKTLTAGEGGILLTSHDDLEARIRSLVNCGRTVGRSYYEHALLGSNFRMSAWQAAVLLAQLERHPAQIALREANVKRLLELLAGEPDLRWQQVPAATTRHPWYLLVGRLQGALAPRRNAFVAHLAAAGVPCTPFYPHTLYQNPLYASQPCRVEPCPEAEARVEDAFWFPHRLFLGSAQLMEQVAALIRHALQLGR